eukprot:GHVQ01038898.1.p1 GENE.GHVQ01038898.1~~GHVQ01038898.1.p1  ORF type:complete len:136 (-),score=1.05 GHVQ01038898.1:488-895(-)
MIMTLMSRWRSDPWRKTGVIILHTCANFGKLPAKYTCMCLYLSGLDESPVEFSETSQHSVIRLLSDILPKYTDNNNNHQNTCAPLLTCKYVLPRRHIARKTTPWAIEILDSMVNTWRAAVFDGVSALTRQWIYSS